MHRLKYIFALLVLTLVAGCTTSKSTVSQNANLAKYQYAAIVNNDTYHIPAELMEYQIQLFDAVENSRLQLVSDLRLHDLSPTQKENLLLVKYGINTRQEETVVTVNFIDYTTGRPVASCRGAYSSLGVAGTSHDIREAIK
ncbi:MAG: hypothetical protein K2M06_09295, partial [Muribaculaceae bacterium]|nr:hypothetical protein [Muribaculaceae bacterium]